MFYLSWANPYKEFSLDNRDGGHDGFIDFLPADEQESIRNMTKVPRMDCCNDPRFRYWLNKDTVVELRSFGKVTRQAWNKLKSFEPRGSLNVSNYLRVIGEPRDVTVTFDFDANKFVVSWRPPWNADVIRGQKMNYLVKFLNRGTRIVRVFSSDELSVEVDANEPGAAGSGGSPAMSNSYLVSVEVVRSGGRQRTRRAYVTVVT